VARCAQLIHLRHQRLRHWFRFESDSNSDGPCRSRCESHGRGGQARGIVNDSPVTLADIADLAALANGIIPADDRDAGAAVVHAGPSIAERMRRSPLAHIYTDGLAAARKYSAEVIGKSIPELNAAEILQLLTHLRDQSPAFFRQIRADVCALYLSDAGVW